MPLRDDLEEHSALRAERLAGRELAPGWQTVEVRVPAAATRPGTNRVQLHFAWSASPRQVFGDPASRALIGTTGVQSPTNLEVHGFSEALRVELAKDGIDLLVVSPGTTETRMAMSWSLVRRYRLIPSNSGCCAKAMTWALRSDLCLPR